MRSNPLIKNADKLVGRGAFGLLRFHDGLRRLLAPRRGGSSDEDVRCIVAIKLCCLGDGLLAAPALRALHVRWPNARLIVLCTPRSADAFATLPFVDETLVLPFTGFGGIGEMLRNAPTTVRMLARARRERPDIAVDLDLYFRATPVLAYLTGAPVRAGFDTEGWDRAGLYTHSVPRDPEKWEADCFLEIVRELGAPTDDKRLEFHVSAEAAERAGELLERHNLRPDSRFIALCPGSSKNWPAKQWPAERFAQVADWARSHRGVAALVIGSKGERDLGDDVVRAANSDIINMAGETSIHETAAVLQRAEALVTNDTGPLHLACAVGTPVVAIFGPTNEAKWGPRGPRDVTILNEACDCRPCYYLSAMPDCEHRRCLLEIPSERVTEALGGIVGRKARAR